MSRLVDLDDIPGLESAIAELQRLDDLRKVDPELRADIERVISEALADNRIANEDATRLRHDLDEITPAAMLAANFHELVPNRPALGAYKHLRYELPKVDPLAEVRQRDHDDPTRLRGLVREIATFTDDREQIVRAAVAHAEACGISEETFVPIIAAALAGVN